MRFGLDSADMRRRAIRLDVHADVDLLVAGGDTVIEAEEALEVDVAVELGRQLLDGAR